MANFDLPVNDTVLAQSLAMQFSAFQLSNPAESVGNWLRDDLGASAVQYVMNGNSGDPVPQRIFAKVGDKVLVVIQCTQNNQSAIRLWNGWQSGAEMTSGNVVNEHIRDAARDIRQEMISQGYYTPHILIAGHSQGGAIASLLAVALLNNRDFSDIRTVTFGAPKAGGSGAYVGLTHQRICRWMTADDPVPLLPPGTALGAIAGALGDVRSARRMTYFTHPTGGVIIGRNPPITTPSSQPLTAVLPAIGNFVGWLVGVEQLSEPHRIATYSAAFAAFNARFPRPSDQRVATAPGTRPNPSSSREVSQQERVFVQNVFNAAADQQRVTLVTPRRKMFIAVRQGRVWSVWLNDQQVAIGPRKKRARAIARLGNQLLIRLLRSGYVDRATLLEQVGSVLAAMSDPSGEFRPPMRTELQGR